MNVFESMKEQAAKQTRDGEVAQAFFGKTRETKFPAPKEKSAKPICPNCNQTFGVRDINSTSKSYAVGTPIEPHRENVTLIAESVMVGHGMGPHQEPGCRVTRDTWDGSYRSQSGTDPFCTQRCALAFARASHRAGYRRVAREATA